MASEVFKHLSFPYKRKGKPKTGNPPQPSEKTKFNKKNRKKHSKTLKDKALNLSNQWSQRLNRREKYGLPNIPEGIPVLLKLDQNFDIEKLKSRYLGFEIVSQEEDGFVIVASDDINLKQFINTINSFSTKEYGSGSVASIYNILSEDERLKRVLSESLYSSWGNIENEKKYIVDIGVECLGKFKVIEEPKREDYKTEQGYKKRLNAWYDSYDKWDELARKRQNEISDFLSNYDGKTLKTTQSQSSFSKLADSFSMRIEISGLGLRDLAENYKYIFEIIEPDEIRLPDYISTVNRDDSPDIELLSPNDKDPSLCIIDSGIQEGHKFLNKAILSDESECFIPGEMSIADQVISGGHGTRVAGAAIYPNGIPIETSSYKFPFWVKNCKVLNEDNKLKEDLYPPVLIKNIIKKYYDNSDKKTRLYNHSINANHPCRLKHMSAWAAEIDNLCYEKDLLVIQSAGNIDRSNSGPINCGIIDHLNSGRKYPDYLLEKSCRISNPAQSMQVITVGSICIDSYNDLDLESIGEKDKPSSFTRSGPGIWDIIKPDVVEYGGDFAKSKSTPVNLSLKKEICPELLRTSPPGPAFDKDSIGTSFSTPKVSHIAAVLEKEFPDWPTILYRALIVQSARWPDWAMRAKQSQYKNILNLIGYGLPNIDRAISNNDYRITILTPDINEIVKNEIHIYEIPIPEELRSIADEYELLLEVTLSYSAKPRRTRRNLRQYLSTWVDWKSSKLGESPVSFYNRVLKGGSKENTDDDGTISWKIGARSNWGQSKGLRRNGGTLQKDWSILKPYEFRDKFCIAVRGHGGWDSKFPAKYVLTVSFEAINKDIKIYNRIRSKVEIEQRQEVRT